MRVDRVRRAPVDLERWPFLWPGCTVGAELGRFPGRPSLPDAAVVAAPGSAIMLLAFERPMRTRITAERIHRFRSADRPVASRA